MRSKTRSMTHAMRFVFVAFLLMAGVSLARGEVVFAPEGRRPSYYPGTAQGAPDQVAFEFYRRWLLPRLDTFRAMAARAKEEKANGGYRGCFGQTAEDCLFVLAHEMPIADEYDKPSVLDPATTDVNGRYGGPRILQFFAFAPGPDDPSARRPSYLQNRRPLSLSLSDSGKVVQIDALQGATSFLQVRTEADYDDTLIYHILRPLTQTACPNLAKLDLYRFIENKLKPPVRDAETRGAAARLRKNVYSSNVESFCGRKLKLEVVTERPPYHPDELDTDVRLVIR